MTLGSPTRTRRSTAGPGIMNGYCARRRTRMTIAYANRLDDMHKACAPTSKSVNYAWGFELELTNLQLIVGWQSGMSSAKMETSLVSTKYSPVYSVGATLLLQLTS